MARLLRRLDAASDGSPRSTVAASVGEPVREAVGTLLTRVRVTAGETDAAPEVVKHRAPGLIQRITGSSTDSAFVNLHAAEVLLVDLYEDEDIRARAPDVLARLRSCLPDSDRRCVMAHALFDGSDDGPQQAATRRCLCLPSLLAGPNLKSTGENCSDRVDGAVQAARRAEFRRTMQLSYDAADERYAGLRSFRNVLAVSSLALTSLVAVLCLIGFFAPEAISMCFDAPTSTMAPAPDADQRMLSVRTAQAAAELKDLLQQLASAGPGETASSHVCPSSPGLSEPGRFDLPIVALMGLLGGALSASIAVQRMRGTSTQYSIPLALTILKLPAGALTAIIGLILVRGAFIPGLSNLDSHGQILAWAVLLGFAQHLVTRSMDQKAKDVLDSIPTKEGPTTTEATVELTTKSIPVVVSDGWPAPARAR